MESLTDRLNAFADQNAPKPPAQLSPQGAPQAPAAPQPAQPLHLVPENPGEAPESPQGADPDVPGPLDQPHAFSRSVVEQAAVLQQMSQQLYYQMTYLDNIARHLDAAANSIVGSPHLAELTKKQATVLMGELNRFFVDGNLLNTQVEFVPKAKIKKPVLKVKKAMVVRIEIPQGWKLTRQESEGSNKPRSSKKF